MADFEVRVTSGAPTVPWVDPQRLNPRGGRLPRVHQAIAPVSVVLQAVVDGAVAPLDSDLDGRLFYAGWAQWSGAAPAAIAQASGQSSVVTLSFTTSHIGHHVLRLRRVGGGAILVHVDVWEVADE